MERQELSMLPLAIANYAAISLLFFAFPTLLRRKRALNPLFQQALTHKRMLNIAHRGGGRIGVENTVEAFVKAAAVSDMLEMDVCETKDKVLVVHHDRSLRRVCGVDKSISEVRFQQLPELKKEVEMHFVEQRTTIATNGEKIPTLQEVFRKFPGLAMNIELKTPSLSAINQLKRLIHLYNRLENTFIGVVPPFEKKLQEIFPESARFVSYGSLPKLILLYLTGLLPFFPIRERALQIPLYTRAYQRMKSRQKGGGWKHQLMFFGLRVGYYVAVPLIWHLRRRGVMTFYWVCNTNSEFKRAIEGGCCGIMTDDPFLLNEYLKGK